MDLITIKEDNCFSSVSTIISSFAGIENVSDLNHHIFCRFVRFIYITLKLIHWKYFVNVLIGLVYFIVINM